MAAKETRLPLMDDLREEFIGETRETLQILSGQLVLWEKTPEDHSLVDSVFRFVHTVKGSCGFLDLPRLLKLSHAAEEVLSAARDGNLAPSTELVTAVLLLIDRISELTDALETGASVRDDDAKLISAMLAFLPQPDGHAEYVQTDDISVPEFLGEIDSDDVYLRNRGRTVRVSLTLLDKLMNGISDLVLSRNEVSRQLRLLTDSADVEHAFGRLTSSVAEMRDSISQMRLQSINRLFSTLPRALRDITVELDKKIDLIIEGNEVEIDREMAEAMRDPLTHILRNAADHGIETATERMAAGKSAIGHIIVLARQSGNQILVEISDDGRGIDVEKLAVKAIERKLYTTAQWQKLSERQRLETIFHPGLSTADTVSAISGRGVGMDVVRTNIHAIGGTIDLDTVPGRGLKVTLRLPLTLSIIAGLSVTAGGQNFGISRSSIVEILSINNRNVMIEDIGGMAVAKIRGRRFAYAMLETILGIEVPKDCAEVTRTLIIVRPAVGATFALNVASVVDNEELVVKPGAPLVMAAGLYAGTTLPDNGRPMLLLDASGLADAIGAQEELFTESACADAVMDSNQAENAASALLFEGTDGVTRAIRLAVVDRMEEVEADQIHFVGGRCCISMDGALHDVHGLDRLRPLGPIKLLRISDGQQATYLSVNDVMDIFAIPAEIAPSVEPIEFEGIVHFAGTPVELINPYRFFQTDAAVDVIGAPKPVCYLEIGADDSWETRILQPLLTASGYRVSYDKADRDTAAVILSSIGNEALDSDDRNVVLRDTVQAASTDAASIYRYDRVALMSAIETKLAGAR
jgi:two-component system, chemotaxis family, sensor kinase CheA